MQQLKEFGRLLKKWWMTFAHALAWINTRLIVSILYFTIIAIPALILKLMRKDSLHRNFEDRQSYWIEKEKIKHTIDEAKHQF